MLFTTANNKVERVLILLAFLLLPLLVFFAMTSSGDKNEISLHDAFVPEHRRSHRAWKKTSVSADVVKKAYDTIKQGPTAFNSSPLRIAIIQSQQAKDKFAPVLAQGNVVPMQTAPLTVVLAYDSDFDHHFDFLSPGSDGAKQYYAQNPDIRAPSAQLNASLQAGYLITALRTQGFDLGPATGFDVVKTDQAFFVDNPQTKSWKSFMYINIGHAAEDAKVVPRAPRFDFEQASHVVV